MSILDTFHSWAYKGRSLIRPEKAIRFFLAVYFLMYLLDIGATVREPLFVVAVSVTGILHYIGKVIKAVSVVNKQQIQEAFQCEVQWDGEMQSTRKRLYRYMFPYMTWCDEFTLTWADGHWLIYARWTIDDNLVCERQVDGWPFFKHIICTGKMNVTTFEALPEYFPKTRILNR